VETPFTVTPCVREHPSCDIPNCECAGVPSEAFVRLASVLFVCDSILE